MTSRRVAVAGVDTAVYEGGEGPPIVLLHGQGECWAVWLPVLDELVATRRVVLADLPGHGESLDHDATLDDTGLSAWVDGLVDATCDEPPVLVGHLLGGAIALRYAIGHGERIRQLVLVDTLGLNWFRPSPRFAVPMVRFMLRPTPERRDRLFERCFTDVDAAAANFGEVWDDLRDYALDRATTDQHEAAMRTMMPRVGVPPVPRRDRDLIRTPTTVIHGRDDLQVPLSAVARACRHHGWPLHVIEDCRDDPVAERPAAFLAALRGSLGQDAEARRVAGR